MKIRLTNFVRLSESRSNVARKPARPAPVRRPARPVPPRKVIRRPTRTYQQAREAIVGAKPVLKDHRRFVESVTIGGDFIAFATSVLTSRAEDRGPRTDSALSEVRLQHQNIVR